MLVIKEAEMPEGCQHCIYFRKHLLVEIVTCKDCKHLCHIEDVPKVLVCGKHNCQQVSGNFYCADGERR
jgi:hypothetical protein